MSITLNGTEGITLDNGSADGAQVTLASSGYSNWNLDNYSGRFRAYYNATEYFTITNAGNVGIGTNNPLRKLVVSNAGADGLEVDTAAGTISLDAYNRSGAAYSNLSITGLTQVFKSGTGATERMRITSAGGVSFGSSGTAYGTSGQVLTSNGDAAPTWNTLSAVTSLNGQTGAITNTDLYAIGSYVIGRPANSTAYSVNTTVAGSSLYATSTANNTYSGGFTTNSGAVLINTGTWRCVSPAFGSGLNAWAGLWVRIS